MKVQMMYLLMDIESIPVQCCNVNVLHVAHLCSTRQQGSHMFSCNDTLDDKHTGEHGNIRYVTLGHGKPWVFRGPVEAVSITAPLNIDVVALLVTIFFLISTQSRVGGGIYDL